jgi:N utilization substance protein A
MNPNEILRIVDSLHRDKNIDKEIVFRAIESALVSAARKQYGEEAEIEFNIDREDGTIDGHCDGTPLDYEEVIGRIGAQTAKQVIIQKVREAERDSLLVEFSEMIDDLINGTVHRNEGSVTTVTLGSVEAILPRSEQIPGESHGPNERIRALVTEVKPQGSRIKVVLSRTRPKLVQRLFEQEIPEIMDGVISINAISREPGHRSKIAVSSIDSKIDCVGACVGVRGNRIRTIIDELGGNERIDIVRWDDDPQVLIRNSLQPAEVDEVILCPMIGRAIVQVREDQLSLAIGKRGQNVRLASKLCGWDIEIMTFDELTSQCERAVAGYSDLDGVDEDLANQLVAEGYLSYDDLSVIEPDNLMEMGGLTAEQVDKIVEQADERALQAEKMMQEQKRLQREEKQRDALLAQQAAQNPAPTPEPVEPVESVEPVEAAATAGDPVAEDPPQEAEDAAKEPPPDADEAPPAESPDSVESTENPETKTESVQSQSE